MRHVLLLAFVAVLLTACRKEYCWQCETTITTLVISPANDTTRIYDSKSDLLCDRTSKEISKDEDKFSTDSTWQDGASTVHRSVKMDCKK